MTKQELIQEYRLSKSYYEGYKEGVRFALRERDTKKLEESAYAALLHENSRQKRIEELQAELESEPQKPSEEK